MVTLRISGFDVKRVMIDQDSGAEIMYPHLFKGLGLKLEDLDKYDAPLIRFDGNTTIPKGMIHLPIQTRDKSGDCKLHSGRCLFVMGEVLSTLHV